MLKKYLRSKKLFLPIIIALALSLFAFTNYCWAQDEPLLSSTTEASYSAGCMSDGNCALSDFTIVAIRAAQIILGVSGSAALLAFVIGGVMFLASAGNKTWIDRGKATITGAVIGLVIVFASWTIIGLIITNTVSSDKAKNWYKSGWFSD